MRGQCEGNMNKIRTKERKTQTQRGQKMKEK
jgi:hypothetical protein